MKRHITNTEDIIGIEVFNTQGENLGKIEALMVDKVEGRIAYVVLSYSGFLDTGDNLFALPWSAFSYNVMDDSFILAIDKEKLKRSPGFDREHWPDMTNPTWSATISNYYQNLPVGRSH